MKTPKLSIITVCFNSEKTIKDTLNSVLIQTFGDYEYLIIDGKSNDSTLNIIKDYELKFNGRLKLFSGKDNGIFDAMNKGILKANGEIIAILNSDDVLYSEYVLEQIIKCFNDSNKEMVYGNLLYVKRNNLDSVVRVWKSKKYNKKLFYYGWAPPHPSLFIKKTVYEKYGVFNTEFKVSSDYELMLRFFVKYSVSSEFLDIMCAKMRTGGISGKNIKSRLIADKEMRLSWQINGLKPYFFTLYFKYLIKTQQFLKAFFFKIK